MKLKALIEKRSDGIDEVPSHNILENYYSFVQEISKFFLIFLLIFRSDND
jgi:hypothetical protein